MNSRHDHLDWMHRHFAEKVVTGSDILAHRGGDVWTTRAMTSFAVHTVRKLFQSKLRATDGACGMTTKATRHFVS